MPKNRHGLELVAEKGNSFLARYGATVLRGGIAAIPTALFTYQARLDLSPQEAWFISYILAHKWDEDLPYPSLRKMAECTAVSVRQLHRIKDAIVEKGYLVIVPRHRESDGGQDSSAYDFSGLFARIEELLRLDGRGVAERQRAPYADGEQNREARTMATPGEPARKAGRAVVSTGTSGKAQARVTLVSPPPLSLPSSGGDVRDNGGDVSHDTGGDVSSDSTGNVSRDTWADALRVTGADARAANPPLSRESHEKKHDSRIRKKEDSSLFSQFVMAVADDLSRELGDAEHATANMSQANRLWRESGMSEDEFVALMQEARRRTRQAQGAQGAGSIQNRAAYFFHVLRSLLAG